MAVTSIWPIKGRVDKVINYARNPEKTHDKKSLLKLHEIEGVIEYAADEMKTETRALVTCLNLSSEENAAKEFMEVKHRYGKEDGRVCYHGYQSFKADEVDADTAHNIGVALAKELWGDRFQVVIATHGGQQSPARACIAVGKGCCVQNEAGCHAKAGATNGFNFYTSGGEVNRKGCVVICNSRQNIRR